MGISIKVLPGVRIHASPGRFVSRTSRSLGRGAASAVRGASRAHADAQRQAARRETERNRNAARSAKEFERAQRRAAEAAREADLIEAAHALQRLVSLHKDVFPAIGRPVAPPVAPVPPSYFLAESMAIETGGQRLHGKARSEAEQRAQFRAEQRAAMVTAEREQQRAATQAGWDAWWAQLTANDPDTVIEVLETAFEDNEASATPLNCEGDAVMVLLTVEPLSLLPDRIPTRTESGKATTRQWSKTSRNEFYGAYVKSAVVATALETFSRAPAINTAVILVIRLCEPTDARRPFEALALLNVVRPGTTGDDEDDDIPLRTTGSTHLVAPIDVSDRPDVASVLDTLNAAAAEAHAEEAAALVSQPVPAGWYPDPSSRHQSRWWDGNQWTSTVLDGSVQALD